MKCDSSLSVTYSPLPTHYTQADLDKVDVFVASGQDADAIYWPPRDPTRQLRAVLSWEPFFFFPLTGALYRKDRAIDEWDLTFGFSPYWNDKAISMFPPDVDSVLLTPPWPKSKKTGFVAFFASNPVTQNKRTEYVAKMMTTIHIDSFGDVLHTADVPAEFNQGDYSARFQAKIEFCRRYRFVLAFENSNEPHYITEKIFNVLEAGAIPVYMGAPNIYDYWPIKSSIINANDFSSPEALAKFLVHVDSNATLYDSYFKWKTEPLPDIVYEHAKTSTHWNLCRACRVWGNTFPDIARTTNPKDVGVSSWGIQ